MSCVMQWLPWVPEAILARDRVSYISSILLREIRRSLIGLRPTSARLRPASTKSCREKTSGTQGMQWYVSDYFVAHQSTLEMIGAIPVQRLNTGIAPEFMFETETAPLPCPGNNSVFVM